MGDLGQEFEQNNPVENVAGKATQKGITETLKKGLSSKAGAEAVKVTAGAAGGPAGIAISITSSVLTSSAGKQIAIALIIFLIFISALIDSMPSIIFNSIFHTNTFHSAIPTTEEDIKRELEDMSVVTDQETTVVNVVRTNLKNAYDNALQSVPVMSLQMGVESDRSLKHLVDNTDNNFTDSTIDTSGEDIEGMALQTTTLNEYGIYAIISAYSVSVEQLKPKNDDSGFHLFQLFEQERNSSTDITNKITKYYKQEVLGTHGNNIYKVTYVGEDTNGKPKIFDDKETKENSDGSTTVIHHYYIKPIIHNFDVQTVCEGSFGITFADNYKGHSINSTISQAVATMTSSYLAMMGKQSHASGNIYGSGTIVGGNVEKYVYSVQDPNMLLYSGSYVSPFDVDWKSVKITSYFGTRLNATTGIGYETHRGVDWGRSHGTNIRTIKGGEVVYVEYSSASTGMGNRLAIDHGGGVASIYAHCSEINVREGDVVATGQVIAKIGSTGRSTGPHLHLEIITNGTNVNPLNYLD